MIEVIVSLALISLVSLASFALVDRLSTLQLRVDDRYQRIEDLHLILADMSDDFAQAAPATLSVSGSFVQIQTIGCNGPAISSVELVENAFNKSISDCPSARLSFGAVENLEIFVIDANGQRHTNWPSPDADDVPAIGLEFTLELQEAASAMKGPVTKLFDLPQGRRP